MSYSMMGATGDTSVPSFTMRNGIAKPKNTPTLDAFKKLQSQLKRFESAVRVDGDIGPGTVKAFNKVMGASSTAEQLATKVLTVTTAVANLAASTSKPAAPPPPPSRPVVQPDGIVKETNPEPHTPESFMDSAIGFATSPLGLAAGAAAVVGLVMLKRRKKGSSAPATTTAVTVPTVA